MAKKLRGDQVFTAQLLREGCVVFLTKDGGWSTDLGAAAVACEALELQRLEKLAEQAVAENLVIEVYPMVVRQEKDRLAPDHIREDLRTKGPSIPYLPTEISYTISQDCEYESDGSRTAA